MGEQARGGGAGAGAGVQVVSVEEDGSYRVCAEALRSVAARADLRALPVAVVSVAGATRGGKSFLLDFFLRYLTAPASARSDGSWLGGEEEPLGGFSWRGGCERDTVGIHLWSEPFVLTQLNGKKVVVLLMDTQGTFDSCSTLQDSTTIFAMSTLLSSVQIFNLSMNIQEDHLQYLQLFTEYGKLVSEESGTPFQVLQFLVRDWSYAYQHPIGAVGGKQFLEKRLEIKDSQPTELKEIRQHIQSCFETVRCFLMPHPGLTVATSPNFTGCLSDISREFKDAILELVPWMFEDNLTLKKISGQEIQLHELEHYFKSYMKVFNSDQLPTPVSILQATSSAFLEASLGMAREVYVTSMTLSSDARSVPRDVMPRIHARAKEAARQVFLSRRTLAAPERAAERLDRLLQELDDLLANYVALNQVKVKTAVAASKAAYEKHLLDASECLLLSELEERHREALDLAVDLFDGSRMPLDDVDGIDKCEDKDRKDLQQELLNFMGLHEKVIQRNEAKIYAAMAAAKQKYMDGICQNHTLTSLCLHVMHMMTLHRTAKDEALVVFESAWRSPESAQNEYRTALVEEISDRYFEVTNINEANNEMALKNAISFYENTMLYEVLCNLCLHPEDLQSEHRTLYASTIDQFYLSRTYGNEGTGRDNYKLRLLEEIPSCFKRCIEVNEQMNNNAVIDARYFYEERMNVGTFLGSPDFNVFSRHIEVKPRAILYFKNTLRRRGPYHEEDEYLDKLIGLIDYDYQWLRTKLFGCCLLSFTILKILGLF